MFCIKSGFPFHLRLLAVTVLPALLTACGGDNSSGNDSARVISGTVVAAPVAGASVVLRDSNGNALSATAISSEDGSWSLPLPDSLPAGVLMIEASGGQYRDEATGALTTAGKLAAAVDATRLNASSSIQLSPVSSIVQQLVSRHELDLDTANSYCKEAFGFAADVSIRPVDATNPGSDAAMEEKLAGLRAAAFSQLTADLGLGSSAQFELLQALADDLADGVLDGHHQTSTVAINATENLPVDIRNRFTSALMAFHNKGTSGLGSDQIGVPVFATTAMSASYRVEYLAGTMPAREGKTQFRLRVTDDGGVAVTGLTPMLMPMMHMGSGMKHSSPVVGCEATATDGEYHCTVYYLMPSTMAGGMSMGYWALEVMLAMNEKVTFYPQVMMAMGDTVMAKLKGQADTIASMNGPENRSWFIFKDELSGMGPYTLTLFIAAKESMMSFPAVFDGKTLDDGMGNTLQVTSMAVQVSVDGAAAVNAIDNGDGSWTVSNLSMTNGAASKLAITLTVNGERKTANGTADGDNAYFSLTPGSM